MADLTSAQVHVYKESGYICQYDCMRPPHDRKRMFQFTCTVAPVMRKKNRYDYVCLQRIISYLYMYKWYVDTERPSQG